MALDLEQALDLAGVAWPTSKKLECPQGHDKDSPSLHLYPDTDSAYCFGCGWTADSYGVLAALTGRPVSSVLAQWSEGYRTTEATKNLSRHSLRRGVEVEIVARTQPLFDAVRKSKRLRRWQRDELLIQASYWYEDLREELMELPPFKIERRLKHIDKEIDDWLERWKV